MIEFENGIWTRGVTVVDANGNESIEHMQVEVTDVPVSELLTAWEDLIGELSEKKLELVNSKELYDGEEFDIVYKSDINFKALYGSTSEKVRKHHAEDVLSELKDEITSLEVSISWINHYIMFIRYVVDWKMKEAE